MKKYIVPGIISGLTLVLSVLLFCYTDLRSLTIWTTNIWDTLANTGNIRLFYEYSAQNIYDLDHAMVGSDILIYLPWAIWNLPIWALQRYAGYEIVTHALPLLWSKLFLFGMFILCIIPVNKISHKITDDGECISRMMFLSVTSLFTITSLCYIGQNDVIVIFPFLMAISSLLEDKRKGFIIWAALSIAFKPFFIFSYVAIILLIEKNLLKIIGYSFLGLSLFVLQKVPFIGASMYSESLSYGPTGNAFKLMIMYVANIPPAGASLFFLGLGSLYLATYFNDKEITPLDIIYSAVAPMMVFFIFTRYESYRPFYLVPLLFILMMAKPQYNRVNLLLETVATGALMAFYLMDDTLYYNPSYIDINTRRLPSIAEWISNYIPGLGYAAFTAIFVLCMILILVINHPKFKYENSVLTMKEENWLLPVRSLIYAIPLVLAVIVKVVN